MLTFATGLVDATSYLGLGRVFAANMTGNIVLLGFGIAGSVNLPVVAPMVSLAGFLLGAGLGGVISARIGAQQRRHFVTAVGLESVLLAAAAAVAAIVDVHAGAATGDAVIALLALAMGLRSSTVKMLAVPDLTTTVLSMTLTGLAAESRLFGGSGKGTLRRAAAVISMLLGALAGALLLQISLTVVLVIAAGLAAATTLGYRALTEE